MERVSKGRGDLEKVCGLVRRLHGLFEAKGCATLVAQ